MNPGNKKDQKQAECIEYITGAAVGFPVVVCVGVGRYGTGTEFQIMPDDEFKSGVEDFWEWHVNNHEQWFATPLEAAADFVEKYVKFHRKNASAVIDLKENIG